MKRWIEKKKEKREKRPTTDVVFLILRMTKQINRIEFVLKWKNWNIVAADAFTEFICWLCPGTLSADLDERDTLLYNIIVSVEEKINTNDYMIKWSRVRRGGDITWSANLKKRFNFLPEMNTRKNASGKF